MLPDAQSCLKLFPTNCRNRPRIYAIAFKGGVVKVGKASQPRGRLRDHWNRGEGEVEWVHLFAPMHERTARAVEMAAPSALAPHLSPVNRSEWFRGDVDRDRVLAALRGCIDKCRAEINEQMRRESESAAKRARAMAVLKSAGITDVSLHMLTVTATAAGA